MSSPNIWLLGLCPLFVTSAAFAQAASTAPIVPVSREITIPSYPDTAQGFEKFVSEMMKLAKAGDLTTLSAYTKSLTLPDPASWYKPVFGDELGAEYTTATEHSRSTLGASVPAALAVLIKDKKTRIEAHKFDRSCDDEATRKEYPLLLKRQSLIPLYDVRFWDNSNTGSIWTYFAYVDGGFRYVGELPAHLPALPGKPAAQQDQSPAVEPPSRVRVGGNIQQVNLTHQVFPVYPQEAKSAHIQGTVLLHAIIGTDGHIQDLTVMEGVCVLSKAAMDAVSGWRYKPLLINGNPAEVDTTVTVIFTLGG